MFIARIFSIIAGFKKYIWTPFRNWFFSIIGGTAIWEYRGAIDMQEYLPAETVEIRITKLQSFLLWITDWKLFFWVNHYWKLMSTFFGFSKYLIIFIIACIFMIIIYRISNYFYNKIRPKRLETEKKGLEALSTIVLKDKLEYDNRKITRDSINLPYFFIIKDPLLQPIETFFISLKINPNDPHYNLIKNKYTQDQVKYVLNLLLKHNVISLEHLKNYNPINI